MINEEITTEKLQNEIQKRAEPAKILINSLHHSFSGEIFDASKRSQRNGRTPARVEVLRRKKATYVSSDGWSETL